MNAPTDICNTLYKFVSSGHSVRVTFLFRQESHQRTGLRGKRDLPIATPFPLRIPQALLLLLRFSLLPFLECVYKKQRSAF